MSVHVVDRKPSKRQAIVSAYELWDMMREFMQRNFGIKDLRSFANNKFIVSRSETDDYHRFIYLLHTHKIEIDKNCSLIVSYLTAADSIYPTTMDEYYKRRDYQNHAKVYCRNISQVHFQQMISDFKFDINDFERYVNAIRKEIGLINEWQKRDLSFKKRLKRADPN